MQTLLISTFSPLLPQADVPIFFDPKSAGGTRYIPLSTLLKITGVESIRGGRKRLIEQPLPEWGIPLHITSVVNVKHVSVLLFKQKGWTDENICAAVRQLTQATDYLFEEYTKTVAFQTALKAYLRDAIKTSLPHWEEKLKPLMLAKLAKDLSLESPTKKQHQHILDEEEEEETESKKKRVKKEEEELFSVDFNEHEIKDMLFLF
jgi:hypothetical protein